MSMIETVNDVNNSFLSRREITCTFAGIGGKLKKLDAVDMVKKQFKLDGKVVIPISMKNQTGRPSITGTFYVYDDEKLAKRHINPVIFTRLEKAKAEKEKLEAPATEEKPAETKEAPESKPLEKKKESKHVEEKS
jgi:ribosomal protein S24E